jgi:hypothetical protein
VKAEADAKEAAKVVKKEKQNAHIRKVAQFKREAMIQEDLMNATPRSPKKCGTAESDSMENEYSMPRPPFISECTTGHDFDSNTVSDEPKVNHDTYLPLDESGDSDNPADMESIDATPIPASKKKKNTSLSLVAAIKPSAAIKLKLNPKKLANIAENAESKEEPVVLKKGQGSRKKGTQVVEDSEPSDKDSPLPPPTKKPRVSAEEKPEAKSVQ